MGLGHACADKVCRDPGSERVQVHQGSINRDEVLTERRIGLTVFVIRFSLFEEHHKLRLLGAGNGAMQSITLRPTQPPFSGPDRPPFQRGASRLAAIYHCSCPNEIIPSR